MSSKYCKLIMVTPENNNKYYEMIYEGGPNFTVNYGRVEKTKVTDSKPISQWNRVYREKTGKGYTDVTEMVATEVQEVVKDKTTLAKIADQLVERFMTLMSNYTNKLVSTTYSVKAEAVSVKQVQEAQKILDGLMKNGKLATATENNEELVKLYTIIPRNMRQVRDHLLPNIKLDKVLEQEQFNLDAMAAQVNMVKKDTKKIKKKDKEIDLLDMLGIKMVAGSPNKGIQYLLDQIPGTRRRVVGIFDIVKDKEDVVFDDWMSKQKNKETRLLIHGTRCTSVIPILEQGLKIRPSGNFQFSGKVYGDGNYYSETVSKSLNYTGSDNDKVLLVYEVHTGKPFTYKGWYTGNSFTLNYKNLQDRGFDSTFVESGNGLLNSEIIAYREEQCRIKHIIWLQ